MLKLHFNGSVFDLHEDQSAADIVNFMDNYTAANNGSTLIKLADGSQVHIQVGDSPTYALVMPEGYKPEGLKVSKRLDKGTKSMPRRIR